MTTRYLLLIAHLLTMASCRPTNPSVMTRLNGSAAINGDLPVNPLRWQVITPGVDPRNATMFTLFGNEVAVRHSRSSSARDYPEGSVLAMATWQQQEDSRWVGGKIPDRALSVEFVDVRVVADGMQSNVYRAYEGSPLKKTTTPGMQADSRVALILSLRAAVMP
jgi:hypothetical protein